MTQTAELRATDAPNGADVGFSISTSNDNVLVGSRGRYDPVGAYMFVKPKGGWSDMTETAKLSAADPRVYSSYRVFGFSEWQDRGGGSAESEQTIILGHGRSLRIHGTEWRVAGYVKQHRADGFGCALRSRVRYCHCDDRESAGGGCAGA